MNWTFALNPTPLQLAICAASAMLAAVIGLFGTVRRGHWLATLLFSSAFLTMAAFQAGTLGILKADGPDLARVWATYLASTSALASWLWLGLSVVLARPDPIGRLRQAAVYLTLALVGCVTLFFVAGTPFVVSEVNGVGGLAEIVLGGLGKIYLIYLVVVMVGVLMNLESMLRSATAETQHRLRPLFVAFFIGIVSELLLVAAGLIQGRIHVSWMAASAVPMFIAGSITAFSLARQSLSDMEVPLGRPIVYSSVSLTLAAIFLLTMGVLSRVLPLLAPESRRGVAVAFYLLGLAAVATLLFSPRVSRSMRRYIDRNFYANRYDYRREWEQVSRAITPTARPEEICRKMEELMRSVFDTDRIAVHLLDDTGASFQRVHPPPGASPADIGLALDAQDRIVTTVHRMRAPLVFRDISTDLDLIPVVVENRPFILAMHLALCAPLHVGDDLIGLLWLSEKRTNEPYSFEDGEFLGAMSRQLAAALGFARMAGELAETRQLESLHRLSTFVLHDIKNQVSGLSLLVENAKRHLGDPDFQRDAVQVVERAVQNLKQLMTQVSGVGKPPVLQPAEVRVRQVLAESLGAAGLAEGESGGLQVTVECREDAAVNLDPGLIARVLGNLLTNAREAMQGAGQIDLRARIESEGEERTLVLVVRDTGPGMPEDFVRTSLFRPFATTKRSGLGIGLMQCKTIVEAHGGTIRAESAVGKGTCFEVRIPTRSRTAYGEARAQTRGRD
jgi:putative PEP-CTERM system histidine kinase